MWPVNGTLTITTRLEPYRKFFLISHLGISFGEGSDASADILFVYFTAPAKWAEKRERKQERIVKGGFGLVWFYGISIIVGYLMPNPFYTYKLFYIKQFSLA